MTFRVFEGPQGVINVEDDGPGKTVQSLTIQTANVPALGIMMGGTASIGGNISVASLAGFQGITVAGTASMARVEATTLVGIGTAINATNGAASAALIAAGTSGNDLAGRVAFLSTAAGGGAQIIHVFAAAFPTNPYPIVIGTGNASFQAGFPTVTTSTNSMTVALTLAPAVGASLAYTYAIHG